MTLKSIFVVSALLVISCGPRQQNEPAPSSVNNESVAIQSNAAADLVPSFPGATPSEVPNLGPPGTDTRSGNTIAMETDASPAEVAEFYRNHFRQAGTPIRADTASDQGGLISVARDGAPGAMISISRVGDKTRIAVTARR